MAPSTVTQPAKEAANLPRLLEVINSGAFGEVYRGVLETGEEVAVKVVLLNENTNYETLERELVICKQVDHPYIVHTYDIIHTNEAVFVMQEYCARGDLFEVIPPLVGIEDEAKVKKYFRQLVDAVAYLHAHKIVHRDIKPENVVITDDDDIRLIDFGLSGFEGEEVDPMVGTVPYMAPEAYARRSRRQHYDGKAADVFSLGIVLHVMLRGFYPWDTPSRHEPTFDSFIINDFSFCQDWAPILDKIFRGCLDLDPRRRFTAAELKDLLADNDDWGLHEEAKAGYPEFRSLALLQEQHGELRRPSHKQDQRDFEIVFTDDARSEQESTDGESLRSFNPDSFNPLKQIPPRRLRFTSECDTGLEIRFDPFYNPETDDVLFVSGPVEVASDEDDETPWWGFKEEDEATESESEDGQVQWGDLTKDMSFSTLPSFGGSDDELSGPKKSSSSSAKRWGDSDSDDDCEEESADSSRWGDMSRDMSFSTLPKFDSETSSEAAAERVVALATTAQGSRCLFSVGEDGDADEEVSESENDVDSPLTDGPQVESGPASFALEPAVRRNSVTTMRKAASQPPRSKADRQRSDTRLSQTPKPGRSLNEAPSPCMCSGAKRENCRCSVGSNLAKWCASTFNLRKAVSCINLPTC